MTRSAIDALCEQLIQEERPLQCLFRHAEECPVEGLDSVDFSEAGPVPMRFAHALLTEADRAKTANLERVVFKRTSLNAFADDLHDLLRRYLAEPRVDCVLDVHDLFGDYLFNDDKRTPISERAYAEVLDGDIRFISCWADGDEELLVSDGVRSEWYVNMDLWLTHRPNIDFLVESYIEKFLQIEQEKGPVDGVCLIQKYAGPRGIIGLRNELAQRLGALSKNVFEYSQRTRSVLPYRGSHVPPRDARVCVFSDVVITGNSLRRVQQVLECPPYEWHLEDVVLLEDYRAKVNGQFSMDVHCVVCDDRFDSAHLQANRGQRVHIENVYSHRELLGYGLPYSPKESPPMATENDERAIPDQEALDFEWWRKHGGDLLSAHKGQWIGVPRGISRMESPQERLIIAGSEDELWSEVARRRVVLTYFKWVEPDEYVDVF